MPTAKEIDRQHAQTVRRLLASEAAAVRLLKTPVTNATSLVQSSVSRQFDPNKRRVVLGAIRAHGPQLRHDTTQAVLAARDVARGHGRDQLTSDLLPVRRWAERNGQVPPPAIRASAHAAELDAFEAGRVASAVHASWGSALMAGLIGWEKRGENGSLASALSVDRFLSPRLERHAATQAASAYADERQSYWDGLAKLVVPDSGDTGDEPPPESGVRRTYGPALFHVWSAVLDERTCEDCAALDGSTVPIDEDFEAGATTPLHPNCRCVVLTTFNEDELDDSDNRVAVGDQVRRTTLPYLMRLF